MTRLDRAEHLFIGEEAFSAIAGTGFPKDALFLDMVSEIDRINHSEWNIENDYFEEVNGIKEKDKSYPNVSIHNFQTWHIISCILRHKNGQCAFYSRMQVSKSRGYLPSPDLCIRLVLVLLVSLEKCNASS